MPNIATLEESIARLVKSLSDAIDRINNRPPLEVPQADIDAINSVSDQLDGLS